MSNESKKNDGASIMFAAKIQALLTHYYIGEVEVSWVGGEYAKYYLEDLLSDILHFCKVNDFDFDLALDSAIEQFTQHEASE